MNNIEIMDLVSAFMGMFLFWILVYSSEKDELDAEDEKVKFHVWCSTWFKKNNDNILAHIVITAFLLIIGIENSKAFLGDKFNIPEGLDSLGAAGLIGFSGSLIADILKRIIKTVKK